MEPQKSKNAWLVVLALLAAVFGSAKLNDVYNDWRAGRNKADMVAPPPEGALILRSELTLKPGVPEQLTAETPGARVEWIILDESHRTEMKAGDGLKLLPKTRDGKEVWVWGSPGKYRVLAYTSVNGTPVPYATCKVTVSDDDK